MLKSPIFIGILHQHGVEVLGVAGDLFAEPCGLVEGFVLVGELDFSDGEAVVVAVELIDFPSVLAIGVLDEIAGLVDYTRFADVEQALDFLNGNLLLPLEAGGARGVADALNGDEALVALP